MFKTTAIYASLTAFALAAGALATEGAAVPIELVQLHGGTVRLTGFASWPGGHDQEQLALSIDDAIVMGGGGAGSANGRFEVGVKGFFSFAFTQGAIPTLSLGAFAVVMNHCEHSGCRGMELLGATKSEAIEFSLADERIVDIALEQSGDSTWSIQVVEGEMIPTATGSLHLMPGLYRVAFQLTAIDEQAASLDLALTLRPPMEGDLDGNGVVDARDITVLLGNWGPHACGVTSDLTNDCQVNENDIFALYYVWTTTDDQ